MGLAGGLGRMQQTQRGWMTGEGEESREVFALAVDRGVNACDWNGHGLAAGSPRSYLRLPREQSQDAPHDAAPDGSDAGRHSEHVDPQQPSIQPGTSKKA